MLCCLITPSWKIFIIDKRTQRMKKWLPQLKQRAIVMNLFQGRLSDGDQEKMVQHYLAVSAGAFLSHVLFWKTLLLFFWMKLLLLLMWNWNSKRNIQAGKGKTVLIITHRMRTVEAADNIGVLSDGIVAENGTLKNLWRKMASIT